ncbi:alpha-galactosidase [Microtetraspora glauca]|uniref:Alpha-galactosidase n=1 Tax=Microtetraspora glauca TaxID=1996 RepID=A0ABV3GTQ3_MICGL
MPVLRAGTRPDTWAVVTGTTAYVVAVESDPATGEARVLQRYWGPRLPGDALAAPLPPAPPRVDSSFFDPRDTAELLPVEGGTRWGVPSLQVTYPGDIRSVEFRYTSARMDGERLTVTLRDDAFGLEADLHVEAVGEVIERWTTLRLDASAPGAVAVGRLDSGNWEIPERDAYRYTGVYGAQLLENQVQRGELPVGETTFTSRSGTTSHRANPWIMIDAGDATEEHGEVWSVALAWSGSWRLTAQHRPEGDLAVTAGFGHDGPRWRLAPGESLETPRVLGLHTTGGFGAASRAWHAYTREHVSPAPREDRPVLYNSWEATAFDVTEEGQLDLARRAAAIGVELFVVDDGWFHRRDSDIRGLGDWWPDRAKFPEGMTRLFDRVRDLGMAAGLWVEPEMVNPDSELYRARPDWVLHYPGRRRDTLRDQLVLNFAREDVRDWALGWLDRLVGEHRLAFLKWDMNRSFTQAGQPGERSDMLWIEHTRGVYAVLDELRRRHPGLRVESCSGGGGRVDLGILRRADQVWTSDNTDARDRQGIQHGMSHVYPANVMAAWVTDAPNPITMREVPLRYRFHVAMAGVLAVGADVRRWSEEDADEARELVARYKAIRPVVQHGTLHRLTGDPGVTRSALQYTLDDLVVVLAYNPYATGKRGPRRLRLAGLDPDAVYEVVEGDDPLKGARWHGAALMAVGVAVPSWFIVGPDYRSDLVVFRKVPS